MKTEVSKMRHQTQVREILRKEMEKGRCRGCPHKIGLGGEYQRTLMMAIMSQKNEAREGGYHGYRT
jgi:hypothetical protein